MLQAATSSDLTRLSEKQESRSKRWVLDKERGLVLPSYLGFQDGKDRHGRPQKVNLFTCSDYYKSDILAFDRLMFPASNRKFPMFDFQRIIMREAMKREFLWLQMMRGGGKTYTIARFVLNYALMHPEVPIVLTGPTFRQALLIFDEIVKMIEMNRRNQNSSVRIENEILGEMKRNTMEAAIRFANGSTIRAIPMGDGAKIRGLRGGVLVIDEFYQMTEEMYESHVKPFLSVKQGGMESKLVHITTSWYTDTFAYRRLMQIASEVKAGNEAYGILDFNLDDLIECQFPLSENIWKDAKRHGNPTTYLMTYYNIWPSSSYRWYEQRAIDSAIDSENGVPIELQRPKGDNSQYFAVVDLAASEKGDSTVILVFKWNEKDQRAECVYGKSGRGIGPNERAWLVHETRKKFQPSFIIYDAHGAIGTDLRETLAKDKLLIDGQIKLVEPLVHHNDYQLRGAHVLIPVSSKDDAVIVALTGMPRDGRIEGEDGLNNLLHSKCRDFLWSGNVVGPGPFYVTEDGDKLYDGSEQQALDVIREAFQQLAEVGLAKDINGQQITTKSGQLVFKTKSGAHDDGAMCIVYGSIGILRLLGSDTPTARQRTLGFSTAMKTAAQIEESNDIHVAQRHTFC